MSCAKRPKRTTGTEPCRPHPLGAGRLWAPASPPLALLGQIGAAGLIERVKLSEILG